MEHPRRGELGSATILHSYTILRVDYDPAGRVSAMTFPRGTTSYIYNAVTGNLESITAPDGGTLTYSYDGALLLSATWAGAVSGSMSSAYDNDFRVVSQSVNGVNTVAFVYDADSLLTQAGSLTLSRDAANGLLTGTTLGNVTDTLTYNSFAEPQSYAASVSGSAVFDVQYTRDALGRITQKAETTGGTITTTDYTYDLAGRLTEVRTNGVVTAYYGYDDNGNRLSRSAGGISAIGICDDQDRLVNYGGNAYTYTANGDLLTKTSGGQSATYDYDLLGNLMSVALPGGTDIEYIVDGQNRRIGKKVNGTLTQGFLYDGQIQIVAELDGSNTVVSRFVYAEKGNVPSYMIKGGVTYRIISDHLGSPRIIVDTSTGAIVQQIDYDEFGNVLSDTNPGFQPFGFAGGLYDQHTKLTRFGARDYDPETGRWTSKDPILFAGGDTNLYGYVFNDPINFIDPLGLYWGEDQVNWWLYESALPGPYGQPLSEWKCEGPTGWGDPMRYTEEAGGRVRIYERIAVGTAIGAMFVAITADYAGVEIGKQGNNVFRIISKRFKWGFRIDKPHPFLKADPWYKQNLPHIEFWRWR